MNPKDIFLFHIGNRGAIERVAGSWWSLLVGAILVLTSGIARNYDHLDLLRNPEWVYGPFIASIVTSLIVFAIVKNYLKLKNNSAEIKGRQYFSFLCLYWMTAPCAWLYGLPVESYTDLLTATKWNIGFLAIVSVWRVALITRSLTVLTKANWIVCLLAVLLPASGVMCIGSFFKGLSLVGIMGGVRLPPHTQLLRDAAGFTMSVSFFLTILTLFAMLAAMPLNKGTRSPLPWRKEKAPSKAILTSIVFLIVGFISVLSVQQKVQRNHHLETLVEQNRYNEALQYASQFQETDFSTIHYLPPNPRYNGREHYHKLLSKFDGSEPQWLNKTWTTQYVDELLNSHAYLRDEDIEFVKNNITVRKLIENHPNPELVRDFKAKISSFSE